MGWSVTGGIARSETWLISRVRGVEGRLERLRGAIAWRGVTGGGVGRVSSRSGAVVHGGSGTRVEGGGEKSSRGGGDWVFLGRGLAIAGGVAWGYLTVEWGEARVVAVRREAKGVRSGGGRNVARGRVLGEHLQRALETLTWVGRQGYYLRSTEPNLMNEKV